jgi:hypothetical protein
LSLITVFVITHQGILNPTPADYLLAVYVYVSYRSQHPDKATVKEVLKKLQDNNIDVSHLVEYGTDHCQKAESSTKEEVPRRDTGVGIGKLLPAISNILGK